MAFWGIQVESGNPVTHAPSAKARLHLSQAILGGRQGIASDQTFVQCQVGNGRAVYICNLKPQETESCPLNLELDESDNVVFSVIGPGTVHLTGYYVPSSSLNHLNLILNHESIQPCGEDSRETGTKRSDSSQKTNEEMLELKQSDVATLTLEALPIEAESNVGKSTVEEKARKQTDEIIMLEGTNSVVGVQLQTESGILNEEKEKHVRDALMLETKVKEESFPQADKGITGYVVLDLEQTEDIEKHESSMSKKEQNQVLGDEELAKEKVLAEGGNNVIGSLVLKQNEGQKLRIKEECNNNDVMGTDIQVDLENEGKKKRKRKRHVEEKASIAKEVESQKICSNVDAVIQDVPMVHEETPKQASDKKKKTKKRSKKDGDGMKMEPQVSSAHNKKK